MAWITTVALIVLVPLLLAALFIEKHQPRSRRAWRVPRPVAALIGIVYVAVYWAMHGNVTGDPKAIFFLGCLAVGGVRLAIKLCVAARAQSSPPEE